MLLISEAGCSDILNVCSPLCKLTLIDISLRCLQTGIYNNNLFIMLFILYGKFPTRAMKSPRFLFSAKPGGSVWAYHISSAKQKAANKIRGSLMFGDVTPRFSQVKRRATHHSHECQFTLLSSQCDLCSHFGHMAALGNL